MGVVARQSILTSIISYTGIVVGYLNLVYLYPKYLELEQIGLLRTVQDAAMLMVPIASLGLPQIISRYFPRYSEQTSRYSGFLGFIVLSAAVGFLLLSLMFSFSQNFILQTFQEKAPEVIGHTGLIIFLVLLLCYYGVFEQLARAQLKIAVPALLREVALRMTQALVLGFYALDWISYEQFLLFSVLLYAVLLFYLLFHLQIFKAKPVLPFKHFSQEEFKEMLFFGFISLIGVGSSMIISKVDSLMVSGMVGLEAAAIYTTTFYMATVIEVPKRAMTQSATAILSIAFEKGDLKACSKIYSQTAINQMIIGGLLLIGLWANSENIFDIMPKGEIYSTGIHIILIIGVTRWIDMSFGPSSEIISLSKHYWFNLVVISVLALATIFFNLYLIPRYGINGAAVGTLISIVLFNFIKFIFISVRLGIQPFGISTLKTLFVIAVTIGINFLMPSFNFVWVDIAIRSASLTLCYVVLIRILNCSPEINEQLKKAFLMLKANS